MSFAAVYLPEFPVAAWLYGTPSLRSRPLVLLKGIPPLQTVASLNAVAQASGIQHGMSKVQAEAVCAACFRSLDGTEEQHGFDAVHEIVSHFSPRVEPVAAPANAYAGQDRLAATLLIDREGTGGLFGTAEAYARRLHHELQAAGFESAVATAPNAEAALMLSRSCRGVLCVGKGDLQKRLALLPTSMLPCDGKTQQLLRRWGIRTLGQLAQLPREGLISRLGQKGLRLQQLACGNAEHLLTPQQAGFTLASRLELDTPVADLERLLFVLSRLLGEIIGKAVDHAYAVRRLTATLALEQGRTHVAHVVPATPTQNRDNLLKLLQLEFEAHPPEAEIVAVQLDGEPAKPQRTQRGLFQAQFPEPDRLDLLLARLRSIAGEHNVGSAALGNSHRDDAFSLETFCPEFVSTQTAAALTRSALRMLRPAETIRVHLADERPHVCFWQGATLRVTHAAGPWCTSGAWWDKTHFDCNYWDVQTETPPLLMRLRQEQTTKSWSLVGLYD